MNYRTNFHTIVPFSLLFLSLSFIYSCKSLIGGKQVNTDISAKTLEAQKQFYHAWLADCVNDLSNDDGQSAAESAFLNKAKNRITGATNDANIINAFGKETLVWGPMLTVDNQVDNYYVSKNLMYCLKSIDASGNPNYSIGIAGTNMIAPYDWFTEDLMVENQIDWSSGGKISKGASIGFNILNNFTDPTTNKLLITFLKNEIALNPNATISVAGHSLGGALTQVYASYLENTLNEPSINAWVYAGPSAGDLTFANALVKQIDSYQAYNNTLDIIPHAWQTDRLNELCGVYDGMTLCDNNFGNNAAINGVIKYLRDISNTGNYTSPGNSIIFTGSPASLSSFECFTLNRVWDLGYFYPYLNEITQKCNAGNEITEDEFDVFIAYLVEMGTQHTTSYFNYFFQDESLQNAVAQYVPGGNDSGLLDNLDEGKIILDTFLVKVNNHLSLNTDCSCQN